MRHKHLEPLFSRREYTTPAILSVYLDTDESKEINLSRGFEKRLDDLLSEIRRTLSDPAEIDRFNKAATRITDFVSAYEVHTRALALFYDVTGDFFWNEALNVSVESQVRWDCELFLQPLVGALDEFEKYGVVLLDHANMRLFKMYLGSLEEVAHEAFDRKAVQHIKSVGMDHLGSASRAQRHADEQVHANLRKMVEDVDALVRAENVEHLILAGTPEMTAELLHSLPKRLALLVVDSIVLPFEAPPAAVLAEASKTAEAFERQGEVRAVRQTVDAAAKQRNAVTGLARTLTAVNQGRVWQLIYTAGFRRPGYECSRCSALFVLERPACSACGSPVRPVRDVVERAVEHSIRHGAAVEVVREEAADALNRKGAIAALLRTRTASVRA